MEVQSGNDRMTAPSTAAWPRPAHEDPAVCVPARVLPEVGSGVQLDWNACQFRVGTLWARTGKRSRETRSEQARGCAFRTRSHAFPTRRLRRKAPTAVPARALVTALRVVGTGVDPVTSRFSGRIRPHFGTIS